MSTGVNSHALAAPIATLNEAAFSISVILSGYLLGILTIQIYIYYNRYPEDPKFLKSVVALICVLDFAQFAACVDFTWWYVVTNWGTAPSLFHVRPSFGIQVILGISLVTIVELMFLRRIWILSERLLLVLPASVLVVVQYTFVITSSALLFRVSADHIFPLYRAVVVTGKSAGLAADLLITATFCVYLLRKRSSCERIDGVMKRLVFYTMNTCLLTSIVSLASTTAFFVMSHNTVNVGINNLLCRLFSNSFMASLNQRSALRHITDKYIIRYPELVVHNESEGPTSLGEPMSFKRCLKSEGEVSDIYPIVKNKSRPNEVYMDLRESNSEAAIRVG